MSRYQLVVVGLALALPYVLYARRRRVFAAGLITAAVIYVAFAIIGGGTMRDLLIELSGFVLFAILAILGVRYSAWFLALGWMAHAGWDLLRHPYVPQSYPMICIGFDLLVAGAIFRFALRRREIVAPP